MVDSFGPSRCGKYVLKSLCQKGHMGQYLKIMMVR